MFELLAKVQSEAWIGFLGVLLGASLSLVGSLISSRASIKQIHLRLSHEEHMERASIKTERLEELYMLLGNWMDNSFRSHLHDMRTCVDDPEKHINDNIDDVKRMRSDINRIEMIIGMHCPELKPSYEKLQEALSEWLDVKAKNKRSYDSGDISAPDYISKINDAMMKLEEANRRLREEASDEVRRQF